jgi:hypothetical protein
MRVGGRQAGRLTERESAELRRIAAERGESMATVIRHAVDAYLDSAAGPAWEDRVGRALAAAGSCRSATGDVADRHDDYFVEAVEGGRRTVRSDDRGKTKG